MNMGNQCRSASSGESGKQTVGNGTAVIRLRTFEEGCTPWMSRNA
jgi:hypothetical protein